MGFSLIHPKLNLASGRSRTYYRFSAVALTPSLSK
nr:MAG TPA: hypothetical protein [Caudoviricetes sp.]